MKIIKKLSLIITLVLINFSINGQQLAFPEAEGFGRFTTGGRGGTVYHVTNLNDDGPGSFRDAVSQSNRIVVFEVGGVIHISSRIVIHSNITVAGQTAPGDGITIYGNGVAFNNDSGNDIIRYIRIRMGKNGDDGKDAIGISDGQNYIFDHVSVSWGRDGTFDINGSAIDNITIQDCIIAQGINNSNHSTGGLMQSGKYSLLRTLFIDNKTRNPKGRSDHEYINNIVYNWGTNGYILGGATTSTETLAQANIINNYLIAGPSMSGGPFTEGTEYFHAYVSDNYVDLDKDGVLNGTVATSGQYTNITFEASAYAYPGVNTLMTAEEAFYYVKDNAGASLVRDEVDEYLISELSSAGTYGAIINTEDDNGILNNVGVVENGFAPFDSDRDGMSDEWEFYYGLNPNDKSDQNLDNDGDGYHNIEEYLNSTDPGSGSGEFDTNTYFINTKHSDKVFTVLGGVETEGAQLVQYALSKEDIQAWDLRKNGTAYYSIYNKKSGLAITVDGGSVAEGANIVQSAYTGADNQLWSIDFVGEGYFSITNKNSGKAITVSTGSMSDDANLIQQTYSDQAYQKFSFSAYASLFNVPVLIVNSPTANSTYLYGDDIVISADASDIDGSIAKVEFFDGASLLTTDIEAPYTFVVKNASVGDHNFKVIATDNDGLSTTSSEIMVSVIGSGVESTYFQEEVTGYCGIDGKTDNIHSGYTGSGFSDTDNAVGQGIDYKAKVTVAGTYTVSIRYGLGTDQNRAAKLLINGTEAVANINFPMVASGDWAQWTTVETSVTFEEGIIDMRLEATTSNGLANIDYIAVEGSSVTPTSCTGETDPTKIYLEQYKGIPGSTIPDLFFHADFPANPSDSVELTALASPYDLDDNYGARIRGFIIPSATGKYTFWISGNENCQLWISADTVPANAKLRGYLTESTDLYEYDKYLTQTSQMTMVTGYKYYFEILLKASTGNDHVEVAWAGPDITQSIIGGEYLSPWLSKDYKEGVPDDIEGISNNDIQIFPNPVNDILYINMVNSSNHIKDVVMYNINGEVLINELFSGYKVEINTESLQSGIYFIKISSEKKTIYRKIIK